MRRAFTLIEITIAIALLGMLAGIVGWQVKKMVDLHHFRKEITLLVSNLQKLQLTALSRRCELELSVYQRDSRWFYKAKSDEPNAIGSLQRETHLRGVHGCQVGPLKNVNFNFTLSPNGRIEPSQPIRFFHRESEEESESILLDLKDKIQIDFLIN